MQRTHEASSNLSIDGHDVATSGRDVLVEARDISMRFGDRQVLDHVDLQIDRGEIVTIVGLNGSGKTTLVRVLLGLATPDSGSVRRAPGLRIGYSPQRVHRDAILPLISPGASSIASCWHVLWSRHLICLYSMSRWPVSMSPARPSSIA